MRKYLALTIVIMLAFGVALVVGCGGGDGDSPAGTYEWKSGEESLKDMTMVLAEDGTMTLKGTVPGLDEEMSFGGEWTQDGSKVTITLTAAGETETEEGEYKDGELEFDEVVWVKK